MDNYLFLPRAADAALYDLAFAVAVGSVLCLLWVPMADAVAHIPPRLLRVTRVAAALLLCALLAQLWLVTATMVGSTATQDVLPQLSNVLTGTHAGRMASAAMLPGVMLVGFSAGALRRSWQRAALATLLVLAILRAATGHAAAQGNFTLDEAVQLLHLSATAVWAGCVIAAGLVIAPRLRKAADAPALTEIGRRVSRAATIAVGVIVASGGYNAWRGLGGSPRLLVHTQWGWLLTVKSVLVLAVLLLGLANRLRLQRNTVFERTDAVRFTKGLRLEAIFMLAILTLSAFLANSMPATMPMG